MICRNINEENVLHHQRRFLWAMMETDKCSIKKLQLVFAWTCGLKLRGDQGWCSRLPSWKYLVSGNLRFINASNFWPPFMHLSFGAFKTKQIAFLQSDQTLFFETNDYLKWLLIIWTVFMNYPFTLFLILVTLPTLFIEKLFNLYMKCIKRIIFWTAIIVLVNL